MKVLAAALVALLLVVSCSLSEAHLVSRAALCAPSVPTDGVPTTCCFTYHPRRIPASLIRSAYTTSSNCAQPGVIFVTKKNKNLCADPRESWVQERLRRFQSLLN
ncbi:CCL3 protein, partial [Semnornis frantzii]|nr:CCL3 protein [Semnornis frantzii]